MENVFKGLEAPFLFVGIGNVLKGDDAAGPEVIHQVRLRALPVDVIDCGEVPENYLSKIARHKKGSILFVDATDMNELPGTVRLFTADRIADTGFFTHGMSLSMIFEYLKDQTSARLYVLGIQPRCLGLGEPLSGEVTKAIGSVVDAIASKEKE